MTEDMEAVLLGRIRELERQLAESEDTLEAIRRGDIDALVVNNRDGDHRVYTLESGDRPYRTLIEQMQEGAVTLSGDGTVIYCNRRVADMLGVAQERVIGRGLVYYLADGEAARFGELLEQAKGCTARSEFHFRTQAGAECPVYVSLSLLQANDTTLFCGVLTDLTEQKIQLQEVARANARLVNEIAERERAQDALRQAQKMEAIGQLTGGIAHDFNNMLQGVTSGITLARRRIAAGRPEDARQFLDAAVVAADRTAMLTRRLLGFGRRQALDPRPVALDKLVGGMESLIQHTVGPQISVDLRNEGISWAVRCDPNQLENALLNLAINARDAMLPDGGRLTLETGHATLDAEDTGLWDDASPGDYVRITVRDTGVGMPADVLEHAFEPFFTTKPHGQGTGLGLSQLHGFILQSNGVVRLESEVGAGTAVHMYLPRCSDSIASGEAAEMSETRPLPARAKEGGSIVLVDDEATVRSFAAETLRELGYRVVEAEDGPAGLKALQEALREPAKNDVRLLVTDVGLPGGLNGRQLADAAREMSSHLPILLITGYAGDAANGNKRLGSGMEMLAKPFELDVLARRVQAMIGEARVQ